MNDERKPKQDPIGHATIPPALRPFLEGTTPMKEKPHGKNPAVEAAFAQINDALGEDVQEIDPDVGVGNASAYVGPMLVPDGAKGRAFTAKVKIVKSDRLPVAAEDAEEAGEEAGRESPWASPAAAAVVPAVVLPSSPAPPVSLPEKENEKEKESASSRKGRSRGRAIAVAIAALGVVLALGVRIVARGPREMANKPEPAVRGSATDAPSAPSARSSGEAVVAPAPVAVPVSPASVDAGASLVPSAAPAPAPYKAKTSAIKSEEPPAEVTPAPVETVAPVVPLPPTASAVVETVAPNVPPPEPTAPKGLPYRKKDH
jgi:DNA polymerase-3 subunit gamma/tau